jgi:sialic acid synthase SpsE|tara:strand:+ start:4671 stop:4838 length:168 start_codon:yes stop_codon:yes gene_type:complete
MAKLTLQRFPDPPQSYDPRNFYELVRQLEQLIQLLNSSYTQQTQEEATRRTWFLA